MGLLNSDFPKGALDLAILRVVALKPIHGYGVAQRIQQLSRNFLQIQQGSLYPALHRLEDRGFLRAEWRESETGRMAKYYVLTIKGRQRLGDELSQWERLTEAMDRLVRGSITET